MNEDGDASKPMSLGQAVSVGIVAGLIAVASYLGYLAFAVFMALASIPSGCGFDADDSCTNPDADNTELAIVLIGGYIAFVAVMTLLERGLLRRYLRQMGLWLSPAQLVVFAGSVVLLPGLALVALYFTTPPLSSRPLAAAATGLVIAVATWAYALRAAARRSAGPS